LLGDDFVEGDVMSLKNFSIFCTDKLEELQKKGSRKGVENVICSIIPAENGKGPRCCLSGYGQREFLRMNSNSYLGLSRHPKIIQAEEDGARRFGAGPGAVRFIRGTYETHIEMEKKLAGFHGR